MKVISSRLGVKQIGLLDNLPNNAASKADRGPDFFTCLWLVFVNLACI